jgi:hypothetical protein
MAGNNDRGGLGLIGVVISGVDQVSDLAPCVGARACCSALACLGALTFGRGNETTGRGTDTTGKACMETVTVVETRAGKHSSSNLVRERRLCPRMV